MERKALFHKSLRPNIATEWLAQHVEPIRDGIVVVVTCTANFSEPPGRIAPMVQGSIVVTHNGHKLPAEIESPPTTFTPKSAAKQYTLRRPISIGGQKISVGFGGKLEVRECGWVPKYLYVKIER
jgi:hypothetical protein